MNNLFQGRRKLAITAISLALAATGATLFISFPSQQAKANLPSGAPQAIPVSVAVVTSQNVTTWDEFSGRLEAVERVDIRPRVAGAVLAVHFREGSQVKAGDLLVTIDPAPYQAGVDRASAQLMAAQAHASYTKGELERANRLWNEHAIAQRDLDERSNAAREAEANLHAAQAALQSAKLDLGYTQVRAPVAGRIGKLEITPGNLVSAGPTSPVLATLVSVNPIYASFDADESTVNKVLADLPGGAGSRAKLESIPVHVGTADSTNTPYTGHLQLVDNLVDAKSGTVRLRAVLDNKDGALMPGQFARILLGQAKKHPALLVSERAVGTDQSKRFVLVVGTDNRANYREVTLGSAVNGLRIVTSGLQSNEQVIVNGLQSVQPGALVLPQKVPMDSNTECQGQATGNDCKS